MILKSYIYEEEIYVDSVYMIISNDEQISYTYKKQNLNILKKSDFNSFVDFIENTVFSEKEYIKNYKYIGFRITFNNNSEIIKSNKIYPVFPWNDNIKNILLKKSSFKEDYSSKFKFYEEDLKNLKIKLNIYENKIKEYEKNEKELKEKILILEKNK
jgi:hypothetical protein